MKSAAPPPKPRFDFQLDLNSGMPVSRQLIDQVLAGIATAALKTGDQLATVRQVAVNLAINPNTVMRAYRELEIRGVLATQQGTGTFIAHQKVERNEVERRRRLGQIVGEFVARAGSEGFAVAELLDHLQDLAAESQPKGR